MMSESMVDRVAKAIHAHSIAIPDWTEMHESGREQFRIEARAAIEAMRDNPDGADAIRILTHSGTWERAEELWQAGIDAILTPSPASK